MMAMTWQVLELQNTLDDLTHRVDKVTALATMVHHSSAGEGRELEAEERELCAGPIHREPDAGGAPRHNPHHAIHQ